MKQGRPTIYTKKLADDICKRLADGESLNKISKDNKMPTRSTIHKWLLEENKEYFSDNYKFSCDIRAEKMADEIVEIADDASLEEVNKARLKIDARKWVTSKILPKKYGDKLDIDHTTKGDKIESSVNVQIDKVYGKSSDSTDDTNGA